MTIGQDYSQEEPGRAEGAQPFLSGICECFSEGLALADLQEAGALLASPPSATTN